MTARRRRRSVRAIGHHLEDVVPVPLYMDRHDLPGATAEDVARVHLADLAIQDRYDVTYTTYWFDPVAESAFCLVHAPSKDAAETVHREAHGFVAAQIMEVDERSVRDFLGQIVEPMPGDPWVATAFRVVLFTDIEGSTDLTQRLGDARAMQVIRDHDEIVRRAIDARGGQVVKHTGDGIMASFLSVTRALETAAAIERDLVQRNRDVEHPFNVRNGIAAGEPVTTHDDLFGATVQLAARLCSAAQPGAVLVSGAVRELAVGKGLAFEDGGELTLKGFDEPVRVYRLCVES
jgi:class 3 adenylate cyclase